MQGPDGTYIFGTVKVGKKGQIVIPKKARDLFDIKPGDTLLLLGDMAQGIAVDSLSLRVEKGEFFALLQSSACFVAALLFGLPLTTKTGRDSLGAIPS